jgi:hypothetical protein
MLVSKAQAEREKEKREKYAALGEKWHECRAHPTGWSILKNCSFR